MSHHINQNDSSLSMIEYLRKENERLIQENTELKVEVESLKKDKNDNYSKLIDLKDSIVVLLDNLENVFRTMSAPQFVINKIREVKLSILS